MTVELTQAPTMRSGFRYQARRRTSRVARSAPFRLHPSSDMTVLLAKKKEFLKRRAQPFGHYDRALE